MQACFLRDVAVIWCNSLGDSHFQTYVIDDVEIVLNYYLHITFCVSHTLTSCTHYTQIFAKFCTYDCVSTNLAIYNCIWTDVQIQSFYLVGNLKKKKFRSLNLVVLTSSLVLIFAFKRHHVFKTFLDHVHLHWVVKTPFKLFFSIKFQDFKVLKFLIVSTNRRSPLTDQKCELLCAKLSASLDWYSIDVRPIEIGKFLVFKFLTDQSFHALHIQIRTCIALFSLSILHFCSHISHCFHTHHAYSLLFFSFFF